MSQNENKGQKETKVEVAARKLSTFTRKLADNSSAPTATELFKTTVISPSVKESSKEKEKEKRE